ncbi:MAG: hypothetical protein IJ979_02550, partial [Tidjanibacter sp.]|nr:hypothetical protein [Tidjanibacter sp.]
ETIFKPTIDAMNAEGRTFKGCLYFGLMLTPPSVCIMLLPIGNTNLPIGKISTSIHKNTILYDIIIQNN